MLDSIIESRENISNGVYNLKLQLSEKEFFAVYDEVNMEAAVDFIKRYLIYKEDGGRPKDIEINYDKESRVVIITTRLRYFKNEYIEKV